MLESKLSREFASLFREYQIWTPSMRYAGWPDRGVQINTHLIWFELKVVQIRYGATTFRVSEFTADQAAFMAKWQRTKGLCFLFLGFEDYDGEFIKYGILAPTNWHVWTSVPKHPVRFEQLLMYTDDKFEILEWFEKITKIFVKEA